MSLIGLDRINHGNAMLGAAGSRMAELEKTPAQIKAAHAPRAKRVNIAFEGSWSAKKKDSFAVASRAKIPAQISAVWL